MTVTQQVITIIIVVLGTMTTRFFSFLVFPSHKKPPEIISYLGQVLPFAMMGLLIVYCLKDAVYSSYHGLIEAIAILFIVFLHNWKHNTLLSIAGGTFFYMILLQNFL